MPESSSRTLNGVDRFIGQFDRALRSLTKNTPGHTRSSPAKASPNVELSTMEQKSAVGLMRVNHSGEVCAQALYQGQALTARLDSIRSEMEQAAEEELDHLAWCEERITQLGSHTSVLNPIWYGLSFAIGAGAGLISDRVSLGFVAATEDQVCHHLQDHLKKLPESDVKSRAIVEVMLEDEHRHGKKALDAGGYRFPAPIKAVMRSISKIMTAVSYRI